MNNRNRIAVLMSLCLLVAAIGTAGFMAVEHYSLAEALYMTVITLSTVGFSEVRPLSGSGRLFTAGLIVVGFVSLALASHALVESLLTRVWSGKSEIRKMKRKIAHLRGHHIICGYGRVGAAAAERLASAGTSFMVIESSPDKIDLLQEKGFLYIQNDATRESVLMEAGIKVARGLLALLDSDPENLFLALTAREMNPTLHIVARADECTSEKKIIRAGADTVVSPFAVTGRQIAEDLLQATGQVPAEDTCQITLDAEPVWTAVDEASDLIGCTIEAAADRLGGKVIGLRRDGSDVIYPDMEIRLRTGDRLLLLGGEGPLRDDRVEAQSAVPKVVIVDDNPVILRLYTRLFQKAGFLPLTATDGQEGVERIVEHAPCVAVVDFELPVLSGIELCRQVRAQDRCRGTRLVLFTGSNHPGTRESALAAGADEVVVKSADAGEIIKTVERVLAKEACNEPVETEKGAVA